MLKGAVLAAGLGTRLQPLTLHRPKPLVPIVGRPLIDFALDALSAVGITTIGVNAYHLGAQLPRALARRAERVVVVDEPSLLGTGGGVRGISQALGPGPLVVINGDALFSFDLAPLLAAHRRSGALATLVLRAVPPDSPFARVGVDAAGRLHRIAEVEGPDANQAPLRYGAFTGVQFIEPALIAAIPEGPCDILRSAYRALLAQRALLRGVFAPPDSLWLDVGTIPRYLDANRAVLQGALPGAPARRVDPSAVLEADAQIDAESCVLGAGVVVGAGARVGPNVWLGEGAQVGAGLRVHDAVVWPGAVVEQDLVEGVALPRAGC